ncbi:hypothetical protein [Filifactor villosus]|uniref:Uncharacterized protein n=1 Tax=Filifactor villosus TaxID=29374 RepID=A0ABV9QPK0_9FIRM
MFQKNGNPYTIPISPEEFARAKNRPMRVSLTVGRSVSSKWFEKAKGNNC